MSKPVSGHGPEAHALICALLGCTLDQMRQQKIRRVELAIDVYEPITLQVHRFVTDEATERIVPVIESLQFTTVPALTDVTHVGSTHVEHGEA